MCPGLKPGGHANVSDDCYIPVSGQSESSELVTTPSEQFGDGVIPCEALVFLCAVNVWGWDHVLTQL